MTEQATPQALNNSLTSLVSEVCAGIAGTNTILHNLRNYAITHNRAALTSMYQENGVIQAIIDAPVDDAFRGGITPKCEELDADDIKELLQYIDTNGVLQNYAQGIKWARLFGGGGCIINAGQDYAKPFRIEAVKDWTPISFIPVDKWELGYQTGGNILDQLTDLTPDVPYNYYGHLLHKTAVLRVSGKDAPSMVRGQFMGWGVSELERIVKAFNTYLKNLNVIFELLDEAKIDVFSFQGFNSSLASAQSSALTANRVALGAQLKNYQNALVIDKEDAYDQKQIAFSGLAEILNEARKVFAGEVRMPLSKIFGFHAGSGLNANDDDLENYNAIVETEIRSKTRGGVIQILRILCMKLFGFVPETITFDYQPLRILTHQEESEIKTQALNRVLAVYQSGLVTSEKAVEILNAEKIFDVELSPDEAIPLDELRDMTGKDGVTTVPGGGAGSTVVS